MKCIIFAAGYATRLYPLTRDTPKPLLKLGGVPIIERIISSLDAHKSIKEIFVVTNSRFFPQFDGWNKKFTSRFDIKVINDGTNSNDNRLGAVGDLKYVIDTQKINDDLLLIAGDNIFEDNLGDLMSIFCKHKKPVIGVFDLGSEDLAGNYGVVEIDRRNIIKNFEEKPSKPQSSLIATFIYALPASSVAIVHSYIANGGGKDLAGNFIRHLSENEEVFAVPLEGQWFDIGTLEQYKLADKKYSR